MAEEAGTQQSERHRQPHFDRDERSSADVEFGISRVVKAVGAGRDFQRKEGTGLEGFSSEGSSFARNQFVKEF